MEQGFSTACDPGTTILIKKQPEDRTLEGTDQMGTILILDVSLAFLNVIYLD